MENYSQASAINVFQKLIFNDCVSFTFWGDPFFAITVPLSGNDDEEDSVASADCSSRKTSEEIDEQIDEQLGEGLSKHVSLGSTLKPSSKWASFELSKFILDKKWIINPWISVRFLLFYSFQPLSQEWILIIRNRRIISCLVMVMKILILPYFWEWVRETFVWFVCSKHSRTVLNSSLYYLI